MVEEISRKCNVCLRHNRTPSRPKVGLPVANDFNKCVALDLKIRHNKKPILYAVDTFSRLTRGIIIKNKEPGSIVRGILDVWVLGKGIGPGIPDRFIVDNGTEFNNADFIDLTEKHGINVQLVTAAYSPYSNGVCEKNHEIVDKMMEKLLDDDNNLSQTQALDYALF